MKEIKVRFRKKTLVPTKHQRNHMHRSDWKLCFVVEYSVSLDFFTTYHTDAQLAMFLRDNFGTGIYSAIAWQKGHEGFWNFIMLEVRDEDFKRMKRKETQEQKENRELIAEKNRLKRLLKNPEVGESRADELRDQMDSIREDVDMNKEIMKFDEIKGCMPYIISLNPPFAYHSYDEQYKPREINENRQKKKDEHKHEEEYKKTHQDDGSVPWL